MFYCDHRTLICNIIACFTLYASIFQFNRFSKDIQSFMRFLNVTRIQYFYTYDPLILINYMIKKRAVNIYIPFILFPLRISNYVSFIFNS